MNFNFQQFYFSVQGRVNRKQLWLRLILPIIVITLVLAFVDRGIGIYHPNTGVGILSGLFALASPIPAILGDIKRWHDRDKSGWWMLIALIPIIGSMWLLIELGFLAGTPGPNRFGLPPNRQAASVHRPVPVFTIADICLLAPHSSAAEHWGPRRVSREPLTVGGCSCSQWCQMPSALALVPPAARPLALIQLGLIVPLWLSAFWAFS